MLLWWLFLRVSELGDMSCIDYHYIIIKHKASHPPQQSLCYLLLSSKFSNARDIFDVLSISNKVKRYRILSENPCCFGKKRREEIDIKLSRIEWWYKSPIKSIKGWCKISTLDDVHYFRAQHTDKLNLPS